jgi:uncharacterized phage protein (TIGR02216 family)
MRFGFSVLRLSAHEFWSMTPVELSYAFSALTVTDAAPKRHDLEQLLIKFPDEEKI